MSNQIGFEPLYEDDDDEVIIKEVQYGEVETLEDEHAHVDSFWSEGYTVALPRYLWAIILTLIVGFASGILRLRVRFW